MENAAVVAIHKGDYKGAAAKLAGKKGFVAALANTLTGNYAAAKANLETAKKCEKLAKRAANDIEFAQFN